MQAFLFQSAIEACEILLYWLFGFVPGTVSQCDGHEGQPIKLIVAVRTSLKAVDQRDGDYMLARMQ
ncbi:hypothetical protein TPL01_31420 [Sulfuriferula plumbiphila]|uniref:Uncharacterized protein n=1 Tax=Sulfuriferula plumbiphila TaxID=171865 RepID=A0A512LBY4_9PROT|nr:hypothetical protein SFPGR_21640 [Sulfuriferula plumbiphila]GEP32004.1 hypothetical protein TPL01_31420 [Sulfuriferula plumbiphila]